MTERQPTNTNDGYRQRYHKIDGWRGYWMPARAIAGSSDTGNWDDSPCPSGEVKDEVARFRKEVLRANGIRSRIRYGTTSNVFCGKRWIVVSDPADFPRAAQLAADWLDAHDHELRYLHSADLEAIGYRPQERAS